MTTYAELENLTVESGDGPSYAYRDTGGEGRPIVLFQHFRGNLDNWDPALIDGLAVNRRVITFDYEGVGGSEGRVAHTIAETAEGSLRFLDAVNVEQVDLLGFSIGSFVAQEIALTRPSVVRKVVLASSAPKGASDMHGWAADVIGAVGTPQTSPDEYVSVFFTPSDASKQAGQQALGRMYARKEKPRHADDLGLPCCSVRRCLRVGDAQPQPSRAGRRSQDAGLRDERRQRPDDPPSLLVPARWAASRCPAQDLP